MFHGSLQPSAMNLAVALAVVFPGHHPADQIQCLVKSHPRKRHGFNLHEMTSLRFQHRVFLSAVGTGGVIDEPILPEPKTVAAAPGVLRELCGERFGIVDRGDGPDSSAM